LIGCVPCWRFASLRPAAGLTQCCCSCYCDRTSCCCGLTSCYSGRTSCCCCCQLLHEL
jgi:hypothetical protein